MRRLTLLLAVCLFALATAPAFAQGPQGDGDFDGEPDVTDKCPTEPGSPGSPTFGCPGNKDSDGDGVPDYADQCPGGGTGFNQPGCAQDDDFDGIPNTTDDCPIEAAGPGEADGCPSLRALVTGSARNIAKLAADPANAGQAQCYYSRRALCSFRLTLTLDAASAKKLKLKKRQIGQMKATTNKHEKAHNLRYISFKWALSAPVKRALKKSKSVTLTMAGTYALGSGEPKAFKPVTFKSVKNDKGKQVGFVDTRELSGPSGPDY